MAIELANSLDGVAVALLTNPPQLYAAFGNVAGIKRRSTGFYVLLLAEPIHVLIDAHPVVNGYATMANQSVMAADQTYLNTLSVLQPPDADAGNVAILNYAADGTLQDLPQVVTVQTWRTPTVD